MAEHTRDKLMKERREQPPIEAAGAPDEEDLSPADVADRVDEDPDEQINRPEQPGVSERELTQYDDPPIEESEPRD